MTTEVRNRIADLDTAREKLAQIRDELKLKVHLAKADAKDEWRGLEQKWEHFENKTRNVRHETEETGKAVWEDMKDIAEDLRKGYERIRKTM